MFEALTERLTGIFGRLSSRGRLTESDVDAALKEVRIALLEADVNFRVARDLIARVRERAVGTEALTGINPSAQVVKAVNDELTATLSGGDHRLHAASQPPTVVALVGLQGSGKTTTAAKLALHLRRSSGASPLLVAADLRRPAAVEQLASLGRQMELPVYTESSTSPAEVAARGVDRARATGASWVVVDTGGRLHVEDELMEELEALRTAVAPHETLLVVDAMTGQDAVQGRGGFPAAGRGHGHRPHQDGRRRTRRGGPLDHGGHRRSRQVHRHGGAARRAGGLPSGPPGFAHPGDGGRPVPGRAGAERGGPAAGPGDGAEATPGHLRPAGLPGAAAGGAAHGPHLAGAGDASRRLRPQGTAERRRSWRGRRSSGWRP